MLTKVILFYLLVINIYGYIIMAVDKKKAIKGRQRIRERHLWITTWVGGAFGVWAAMKRRRHKTKHLSFRIGVPLLCLFHLLLWGFIILH